MKKKFSDLSGPVLTAIMAGEPPSEFMAQMKNAQEAGAQAIAIDLFDLSAEQRHLEALQSIIAAVKLPVMAIAYRNDRIYGGDDEKRQELLRLAAQAGAAMIDVMADLYDPSEREISRNPEALARQRELIAEYQSLGAEVVLSSHTNCPLDRHETLEHLQSLAARGADVVKLVSTVNNGSELAEAFAATLLLKERLSLPFIHLCSGSFSRPHRLLCPLLGTKIYFALERHSAKYPSFPQPSIKSMLAVMQNAHWHIDEML